MHREKIDVIKRSVLAAALAKEVRKKMKYADGIIAAMFRLSYAGPPINIKNLNKLKGDGI